MKQCQAQGQPHCKMTATRNDARATEDQQTNGERPVRQNQCQAVSGQAVRHVTLDGRRASTDRDEQLEAPQRKGISKGREVDCIKVGGGGDQTRAGRRNREDLLQYGRHIWPR